MTAPTPPAVVCADLHFDWPDGTPVLDGLDTAFGSGRAGLVGRNGTGKSTLLRLIAGELSPGRGTVSVSGTVGYLPQTLPLQTGRTVADLLAITERRAALRAIEHGDADPVHFSTVGDDWDVEARALGALARLGVGDADPAVLERPVGTLSGGEAMLSAVAGLLLRRPDVALLDEPTNNLDEHARGLLYDTIESWPGVVVIAGHDRALLERMTEIVELRGGSAQVFGGPYSAYAQAVVAEQQTAARLLRVAKGDAARQQRQWRDAQVRLARRARTAQKAEREKRVPKIISHGRRGEAQVSAAKYRHLHADRLDTARNALTVAADAVRDDGEIHVDLPASAVPAGKDVLHIGTLVVRGPERIALTGRNGSGKTMLLESIAHAHPQAQARVPVGYLPQRLDLLDDTLSVLDNVRVAAPSASPHDVRAGLARFGIRGAALGRPAGTLSGGERLRVCLASLLLAEPTPQLLLLDEPTNNLDVASVAQLTDALRGYAGALLVASHDRRFLADIAVIREWHLRGMHRSIEDVGAAGAG